MINILLNRQKFVIHDVNTLKTKEDCILIKNVTANDSLLNKLSICISNSCHIRKLGQACVTSTSLLRWRQKVIFPIICLLNQEV